MPEYQGEPEYVATEKCKLAASTVGGPVICEDTSLSFTALEGLPGVYIKSFLKKLGHDGLNTLLAGHDDKTATARCIFAYSAGPGEDVSLFVGTCDGSIVPPQGEGFGWDPIFRPAEADGRTFAEMAGDEKNAISHRRRAVDKLRAFLDGSSTANAEE